LIIVNLMVCFLPKKKSLIKLSILSYLLVFKSFIIFKIKNQNEMKKIWNWQQFTWNIIIRHSNNIFYENIEENAVESHVYCKQEEKN
jgi:hypothetical protein